MRNTVSDPLGKCTELVKLRVSADMKDRIAEQQRSLGVGESELVRLIIAKHLYGAKSVRSIYQQKLDLVSTMFPEE